MKKIRLNYLLLTGLVLAGFCSCSKDEDFDAQGGQLPTHYINIMDSSFSPAVLTVAYGSSVTFLNKTTNGHTIVSEDSAAIVSPLIAPDLSYYVKPDTSSASAQIIVNYHCKEHPLVTGTIILTQ